MEPILEKNLEPEGVGGGAASVSSEVVIFVGVSASDFTTDDVSSLSATIFTSSSGEAMVTLLYPFHNLTINIYRTILGR